MDEIKRNEILEFLYFCRLRKSTKLVPVPPRGAADFENLTCFSDSLLSVSSTSAPWACRAPSARPYVSALVLPLRWQLFVAVPAFRAVTSPESLPPTLIRRSRFRVDALAFRRPASLAFLDGFWLCRIRPTG